MSFRSQKKKQMNINQYKAEKKGTLISRNKKGIWNFIEERFNVKIYIDKRD